MSRASNDAVWDNAEDDRVRSQRLVLRLALALIATFVVLIGMRFARRQGLVSDFIEDLTTLVFACGVLSPMVFAIWRARMKTGLRCALLISAGALFLNRLQDVLDELPSLDEFPLIGAHSRLREMSRDSVGVAAIVSLGVAIHLLAAEARRRVRTLLGELTRDTSTLIGADFLAGLVLGIARTLEVKYVFFAPRPPEASKEIRTLAFASSGELAENLTDSVVGAPCEITVAGREPVHIPNGLRERFPDSVLVRRLGAESYHGVPVLSRTGEALGYICLMHDAPMRLSPDEVMTLRLFADRAAAELERERSDEQRRELEARMLEAQKRESLGALAGGVAHDFNNLLTAVIGHAQLAEGELTPGSGPWSSVRQITHAAKQAAGLCNQMLAYAGRARLSEQLFDLNTVVNDTLSIVRRSICRRARVEIDLAPGLPSLKGDPTQVSQVLINLVTNSSDAIEARGTSAEGRIGVRTLAVPAASTGGAPGGNGGPLAMTVVLEVNDNGCGMDEATRARMFDPFFSTKGAGRGLGLAAVLGVARSHCGELNVDSRPGVGTVVRLEIPAPHRSAGTARLPAAVGARPALLEGASVLIVDDEARIREVISRALLAHGLRVLTARSGEEAIEICASQPRSVSVVLLDVTMPGIGGVAALQELRKLDPMLPIVMMSGYGADGAFPQAGNANARFLQKPFAIDELLEVLQSSVAARKN
jgi:signal transduction histidine kinase